MLKSNFSTALFDGGWRADDHDQLMQEYGFTADEAAAICEDLAEIEKWVVTMENIILESFNEQNGTNYYSLSSLCADYSLREVFSSWLENVGIVGYTSKILEVLSVLWFCE